MSVTFAHRSYQKCANSVHDAGRVSQQLVGGRQQAGKRRAGRGGTCLQKMRQLLRLAQVATEPLRETPRRALYKCSEGSARERTWPVTIEFGQRRIQRTILNR